MPLLWIKLWIESLDDLKLVRLTLAERGAWWGLLSLAGKCNAEGKVAFGAVGFTINQIADALHIKTPQDRQSLESMIKKMESFGALVWNADTLTIVHYKDRQKVPLSSTPEAIADRVKRFRDKQKREDPKRYKKGKYGHMVATTREDVKRIKNRRAEIEGASSPKGENSK